MLCSMYQSCPSLDVCFLLFVWCHSFGIIVSTEWQHWPAFLYIYIVVQKENLSVECVILLLFDITC